MLRTTTMSSHHDQQDDYFDIDQGDSNVYAQMNNVPLRTADGLSKEQLLAY